MLVEFYLTCIFHHVWEKFSIYGIHIPRKYIESMHFYSCFNPPLKTPGRIFLEIRFAQDKSDGGNYDLLYQNSVRKYKDDVEH